MHGGCNLPRQSSQLSLLLMTFMRSFSHDTQQTHGKDHNNHHGGLEPAWGGEVRVKYFIEVDELERGSEFIRATLRPLHPLDAGSLDHPVGPGECIACSVDILMFCLCWRRDGVNGQRWRSLVVDCRGTLQERKSCVGCELLSAC